MSLHLDVMVQQTMVDLIAAYELSVVEVSESEVLLKSALLHNSDSSKVAPTPGGFQA